MNQCSKSLDLRTASANIDVANVSKTFGGKHRHARSYEAKVAKTFGPIDQWAETLGEFRYSEAPKRAETLGDFRYVGFPIFKGR
ncbi:MAG: hypothetical protein AAF664_22095, partial [Planctomycetota bacterium]